MSNYYKNEDEELIKYEYKTKEELSEMYKPHRINCWNEPEYIDKIWVGGKLENKENKENLLLEAVSKGDYETVKFLLERGYKAYTQNSFALVEAISKGHTKIALLLIKNGADISESEFLLMLSKYDGLKIDYRIRYYFIKNYITINRKWFRFR